MIKIIFLKRWSTWRIIIGDKIGIMTPETMHITALGSNYGGYFPRVIDQTEFLDCANFHY
jgi:hypothetical protein